MEYTYETVLVCDEMVTFIIGILVWFDYYQQLKYSDSENVSFEDTMLKPFLNVLYLYYVQILNFGKY